MDRVKYNHVIQFDDLQNSFAEIAQSLKLPSYPLPSLKDLGIRPQETKERMTELYGNETYSESSCKKKVYKLLEKDFMAFDYKQ